MFALALDVDGNSIGRRLPGNAAAPSSRTSRRRMSPSGKTIVVCSDERREIELAVKFGVSRCFAAADVTGAASENRFVQSQARPSQQLESIEQFRRRKHGFRFRIAFGDRARRKTVAGSGATAREPRSTANSNTSVDAVPVCKNRPRSRQPTDHGCGFFG